MPPIRCRSTIVCLPRGAKLHSTGVRRKIGWMSAQPELDARLAGQGQQVQDAVGRAADGRDRRRRVLERLPRQDVARPQVLLQQVLHGLADPPAFRAASAASTAGIELL